MTSITSTPQECPFCDGTGWRPDPDRNGVIPCDCRARTRVARATVSARIPPRYEDCSFTNFQLLNESLKWAHASVVKYWEEYPFGEDRGLMLIGDPGVGKTHLAVALLKGLIERGAEGLFIDYQELLKRIQNTYDRASQTPERGVMAPVLETEVVLIDDLGANRITDWTEDTINYILNHRYNEKKRTLLTSNLNPELVTGEPGERKTQANFEERVGLRVASRLHEMCKIVRIRADDYRRR